MHLYLPWDFVDRDAKTSFFRINSSLEPLVSIVLIAFAAAARLAFLAEFCFLVFAAFFAALILARFVFAAIFYRSFGYR